MKSGIKLICTILAIIMVAELIPYLTKAPFLKKYIAAWDRKDQLYTDSISELEGFSTNKVPLDYLNILNVTAKNDSSKLKFSKTTEFKFRFPISKFIYDEKYLIQVCRVDTLTHINFKKDIIENFVESAPNSFW